MSTAYHPGRRYNIGLKWAFRKALATSIDGLLTKLQGQYAKKSPMKEIPEELDMPIRAVLRHATMDHVPLALH